MPGPSPPSELVVAKTSGPPGSRAGRNLEPFISNTHFMGGGEKAEIQRGVPI